ncbi:hypothetical protein GC176_09730 [bacterium]|nr:hypothetical protein [bacterium]
MSIVSFLALLTTFIVAFRGFHRLRRTTLVTAACWALAGLAVADGAALLEINTGGNRPALSDFAWYSSAVLLLCPGIAVLGARKPGAAAWSWFVLLPLVLVLMWPAVASTSLQNASHHLELEEPAVLGFAVVLIMASGNYFGTRYTLPSLLFGVSVALFVGPLSPLTAGLLPSTRVSRLIGSLLLSAAALIALGRSRMPVAIPDGPSAPLEVVWFEFVDMFGMVWAKRVMDRVNQSATHEKWAGRLELHGFVWQPDCSDEDRSHTEERLDHTLRWLLKRFVEPDWIDGVIGNE